MTAVYRHDPMLDSVREWVTDDPTFSKLRTLIRSADDGDIGETLQAFEEMEVKDPHLYGVASTRRMALTGLEWEVVSAAESQRFKGDKVLADEAAKFTGESLANLSWVGPDGIPQTFDATLCHLADAIGPNLAMTEIVWRGPDVERLIPIPSHRICANPQDLSRVWIQTSEHRSGEPLEGDKWVIHRPRSKPGFAYVPSLSYAVAFLWLVKLLATVDYSTYMTRFGIPMVWAKVGKAPDSGEKTALQTMLANMGTAGWAMFSGEVEVNVLESAQRGTAPQQALIDWCERKESIAFLGQPLTTDTTGGTGTFAAAAVHNQVRADLLQDDIRSEGATIRGQLLLPMCKYHFPGRDVPLPLFRRIVPEPRDEVVELDKIVKAQAAGADVSREYLHNVTGIEKPKEGDEADRLEPVSSNPFADEGPPL